MIHVKTDVPIFRSSARYDTALITLATVRERRARFAEAAELLRSALVLRPGKPEVQCQLGLLELRHGRTEEARSLMTPAPRSTPALRERTLEIARAARWSLSRTSRAYASGY